MPKKILTSHLKVLSCLFRVTAEVSGLTGMTSGIDSGTGLPPLVALWNSLNCVSPQATPIGIDFENASPETFSLFCWGMSLYLQ